MASSICFQHDAAQNLRCESPQCPQIHLDTLNPEDANRMSRARAAHKRAQERRANRGGGIEISGAHILHAISTSSTIVTPVGDESASCLLSSGDQVQNLDRKCTPEEDFIAYYRAQQLFKTKDIDEDTAAEEFDALMAKMHERLPKMLRVPGTRPFKAAIERRLAKSQWQRKVGLGANEANLRDAEADSVWELPIVLYKGLQRRWAERENNRRAIVFQELVSQIPPLLLGVRPGDAVLDMCASPGNKSMQIAERLLKNNTLEGNSGVLVASDVDPTRCTKLLGYALQGVAFLGAMVLQANARDHPLFEDCCSSTQLLYDRILADVPCSGDGTCRKDPSILHEKWSRKSAVGLHRCQVDILDRALTLLRPGGTLVYSTCSLNPLEDEAVVSAVSQRWLQKCQVPCIELLDAPAMTQQLIGMKACPGITKWLVPDPKPFGTMFASWQDVPDHLTTCGKMSLTSTMFPPAEDAHFDARMLQRCARFLPHDNDTGGFFVAVIRKGELDRASTSQHSQYATNATEDISRSHEIRSIGKPAGWEPSSHLGAWFERAAVDDQEWKDIKGFFQLADDMEQALLEGRMFWQVSFPSCQRRRLCLLSSAAARRYESRLPSGKEARSLPWIRLGVCLFERLRDNFLVDTRMRGGSSLTRCRWRPCDEGATLLASKECLGRRRLFLRPSNLLQLLQCEVSMQQINLGELSEEARCVLLHECRGDAPELEVGSDRQPVSGTVLEHGCGGVLVGVSGGGIGSPQHTDGSIWLPGVLTPKQLRIFVQEPEAKALAEILSGTYEDL